LKPETHIQQAISGMWPILPVPLRRRWVLQLIKLKASVRQAQFMISARYPYELVSNALKHAFPEGRGGEVNIRMATAADQFVLKVQDNGIGFPVAVDFLNPRSLGLELVRLLVEQINGAIDLRVEGGAASTITFPATSKGG